MNVHWEGQNPLEPWFDDLSPGYRWRSEGRTVTRTDVGLFEEVSGYSPRATAGAARVPKLYLLSITGCLFRPVSFRTVIALYGIDDVTWPSPAAFGTTLYGQLTVEELDPRDDGGVVTFDERVLDERSGVTVRATLRSKLRCRPDPQGARC